MTLERLADTAPAALVVLIALGFVTAITLRALSILDRLVNRKDDDDVPR